MPAQKCRILYVDDHDDSAEMLKLILAEADYEVETARTVAQALQIAAQGNFDLYVLDKRLPDGSGLELIEKLNEVTPGVPALIYSGDVYEAHRREALEAGAHAHVPKPDIEKLIDTIHRFLSSRQCATTG